MKPYEVSVLREYKLDSNHVCYKYRACKIEGAIDSLV